MRVCFAGGGLIFWETIGTSVKKINETYEVKQEHFLFSVSMNWNIGLKSTFVWSVNKIHQQVILNLIIELYFLFHTVV